MRKIAMYSTTELDFLFIAKKYHVSVCRVFPKNISSGVRKRKEWREGV